MAKKPEIRIIWTPHKGPQEDFLNCKEFEVLYGGAKSGGKSDALIICLLTPGYIRTQGYKGLLVRRTFKRLMELKDRCDRIYLKIDPGCRYTKDEHRYYFSSGAIIQLGHCEHEDDKWNYWGHEYQIICTEVGTKVLMADSTYKNVESLIPGDLVQTLSGPRKITAAQKPRLAECVEATTQYGSQVQTLEHSLLAYNGKWSSYADLYQSEPSLATGLQGSRKLSSASCDKHGTCLRTHGNPLVGHCDIAKPVNEVLDHECRQGSFFSLKDSQNGSLKFGDLHQGSQQLLRLSCLVKLHGPSLQLSYSHSLSGGAEDVHREKRPVNFLSGCHPSSHLCDGRLPGQTNIARDGVPLPDDAGGQIQTACMMDGLGSIPRHIRGNSFVYEHPYTKVDQLALSDVVDAPCVSTPCGKRMVVDITVEEQNHYITLGGFVNKNCLDQVEEFTESQYGIIRMCARSTVKGLKPIIRATANPGVKWVKEYWIDTGVPPNEVFTYTVKTPDGSEVSLTKRFIPATIYDNKTMVEQNPEYIAILASEPNERLRRMNLYGEWDVPENAAFDEFDKKVHVKKTVELFPGTGVPTSNWTCFGTLDWGFSKPFAMYWHVITPYDKIITFREYYGIKFDPNTRKFKRNVGERLLGKDVAKRICEMSTDVNMQFIIADSSIFDSVGQEAGSVGLEMQLVLAEKGISMVKSIKGQGSRLSRKMQTHNRLSKAPDGQPYWLIADCCQHLIRTIQELPIDENKTDTIDTDSEDHAWDSVSYGFLQFPLQLELSGHAPQIHSELEPYRQRIIQTPDFSLASTYH